MSQGAFAFMPEEPRRPKRPERLFLGVFPDELAADAADRLSRVVSREIGLTGSMLKPNRLHTSLLHLSDRKRLRSLDVYAAELAAKVVTIAPFELVFDCLASFPGAPRKGRPVEHPLVLLAQPGPVMELHAMLGKGLREYRFRVPEHFRPHLTLSYNAEFVAERSIEPIRFVVREFALVHSELWLTRYHILRTWTLH